MLFSALVPSTAAAAPPDCATTYTRSHFHKAARSYFHKPTQAKRKTVRKIVRCQRSARSRRIVRFHLRRYRRAYIRRQQLRSITPYDCGRPGRFAIPCRIVACESGFSWSAWNPSGAAGPYQLLGKGAPMPANTAAKRMTHHRIAYNLWAGGAGASHWVCK